MSDTTGRWTQQTPNTDLQIFLGASELFDVAGVATHASSAAGLFTLNLASTAAGTFFANITAALKRTGQLATAQIDQRQFGTAANVPGPSSVSGTSGPKALPQGFPLVGLAAQLPTVAGPVTGAAGKGIYVTSLDVIYEVNTVNASLATIGLTTTSFVNGAAPTIKSLLALGANGLPTAFGTAGDPAVTNIAISSSNQVMITAKDSNLLVNLNLTAGSGGTIKLHGIVANCSYNLN